MITRQEMAELYGEENLVTLSEEDVERFQLRPDDAEVATTIGLPRFSSPFFTTEVVGGRSSFAPSTYGRGTGRTIARSSSAGRLATRG